MARKRLVSPQFFQHGDLYDLEQSSGLPVRLAFAGLWTQADRRGIFAWKSRELKLAVLPYDEVDFDLVLWTLASGGFVQCFEVDGKRFGLIPSFADHQTFHKDEKPDPKLPDVSEGVVVAAVARLSTTAPAEQPREHGASTVPTPCQHGANLPITITVTDTITSTVKSARSRSAGKAVEEKAWPHFGAPERKRCLEAFRRVGDYHAGRVVNAMGPFFRPATDPAYVPHDLVAFAVEDYCGIIGRGQSARFASPEDCGKKLQLMAQNCVRYADDALGRFDAQMVAVHGNTRVAA